MIGAGSDPRAAQRAAAAVLHERRFHTPSVPRPLHGLLNGIGDGLGGLGRLLSRAANALGGIGAIGPWFGWLVLGVLALGLALLLGRYAVALRGSRGRPAPTATNGTVLPGAEELERQARLAEREGRLEAALRLRFRAGLTRLASSGWSGSPETQPSGVIARTLRSTEFDRLAARLDAVAYGGAPASGADLEDARVGWRAVLGERSAAR